MRRFALAVAVVLGLAALTTSSVLTAQSAPPLTPFRGLIDHVSVNMNGWPSGTSQSDVHSISGDGRFVVFSSNASDLVSNDWNGLDDVFLRDRMTGTTTRVSVADDGSESNGFSQYTAISSNGRQIAFSSGATNLVAGDTNSHWDVFVRDLDANRTVRVSISSTGEQGDADSYSPSISADGRYVAFISAATWAGTAQYGPMQVWIHDRDTDENGIFDEENGTMTRLVSRDFSGVGAANQYCVRPRVSADGRHVMFESGATNLDPVGNPNGQNHLYVYDRLNAQTTLIDRSVTGGPSSWGVSWQSSDMSDDGRFVAYTSISPDIVPFDMNWQAQVFLYDATADPIARTTIVSRLTGGSLADASSYYTTVSADGRYVGFMTAATNLAAPAPPAGGNSFALVVRDGLDGSFRRVDIVEWPSGEVPFDGQYVFSPSLSADGTAIAFQSDAQNAVDGFYTGGSHHIFVATAFSASPTSESFSRAGGAGAIEVDTTAVSGWKAVTYDSWITLMNGAQFGAGPRAVQYLVSSNDSGIVRDGLIRVGTKFVAIHQDGDGDTTPPVITPIITGTQGGNGWYTSDITVSWTVSDPDSEITYIGPGCGTATFTGDFIFANPTCEATSHGGPASVSVPLKRDTTPPAIQINLPVAALYPRNSFVQASFFCNDANLYSGVAFCAVTEGFSPLDTTTPGRHRFTVTAIDNAGNSASKTVEYLVGTDVCVVPSVSPETNLKAWFAFDDDQRDTVSGRYLGPSVASGAFWSAVAGDGWGNLAYGNYLYGIEGSSLLAGSGLTIAAWINPWGFSGPFGTIVDNPLQYRVARFPDGTLRWAFNTSTGFDWVNTGVQIPFNAWSHIAITYSGGLVQTFINGTLAHSATLSGTLMSDGAGPTESITIGGRPDVASTLFATFDDLMIFDEALTSGDIDSLALAGGGSLCVPNTSTIAVTAPSAVEYAASFNVTALLTDGSGNPLANRPINIGSHIGPNGYLYEWQTRTGADGSVTVPLQSSLSASLGDYPNAISVRFLGDVSHQPSSVDRDATLVPGTPTITWPSPAPITYGTALGAQLNAIANITGTYVFSPAAGTVLDAGTQTLSVTFTPDDTDHYAPRTVTTTIVVNKATPTVDISSAPLFYTGQPRQATVAVRGLGGVELNPFTVTYNGGTTLPVNAGTYAVQVNYAGSANYQAVTGTGSLVIDKATPIVPTINDVTETYDGLTHGINVTIVGVNNESLTPVIITYNGSATAPTNAGVYAMEIRYDGSANYTAVSRSATLTILKAAPYLQWTNPSSITYGTPLGASQLNPTSNVPGTFMYSPPAGTVLTAGTHTLSATFTPSDTQNYQTESISRPIDVSKATAQVTWYAPAPIVYGAPLGPAQLNATAPVPGTLTYAPPSGTILNAGAHILNVTFTPDDSANYNGSSAGVPLTVMKVTPTVSWSSPPDIVYGTALSGTELNATANAPGTLAYSPAAGTVLGAGAHTLSATFTPADPDNYNGATASVPLNVRKAASTITWPTPADIVYGSALGATQLNATASVPGTFTYSPGAGAILGAGPRTLTVTFAPTDAANYDAATTSVLLNVTKAPSTITWPTPSAIVYGTALGASQLNATSSVAGAFVYLPAAGAVLNAGPQTLEATFTPDDTANYTGATATVTLNVTRAASTVTWSSPTDIVYGTALSATQLNAAASVPGAFAYSPAAGTVLNAGTQTLTVTFTPSDAVNYTGATASVTLNVTKAASTITWPSPNPIVYGTALGVTQLNATANVPGTFVYSPAAGTVPGAGTRTLSVTFTPSDTANYIGSSASRSLTVAPAPLTIRAIDSSKVFGAPLPSFSASGAGFVNGDSFASLAGSLTFSTSATVTSAVGTYAVTPSGLGSPNYSITFANGALTVIPASTATAVAAAPNPDGLNQAVTLTAGVSVVAPGAGAPTGIVQFFDGGTLLGSASLIGGAASLTTNGFAAGSHSIAASYSGDGSFTTSTGNASLTVNSAAASSTTVVTSSNGSSAAGQSVTLTATVTAPAGLSGNVQFYDGSTLLGTIAISGTTARLTTSQLAVGGHAITARFLGDGTIPPSSSPAFAQYVEASGAHPKNSTTALAASPSPATLGQAVTLTATVTGAQNRAPSGTVLFMLNGSVLGQGTLSQTGTITSAATFNATSLPHGTHRVEAVYLGDSAFRSSTTAISLVVN